MKTSIVSIAIHRDSESRLLGEGVIIVSVEDEGAGEYVTITQPDRTEAGIALCVDELQALIAAVERLEVKP